MLTFKFTSSEKVRQAHSWGAWYCDQHNMAYWHLHDHGNDPCSWCKRMNERRRSPRQGTTSLLHSEAIRWLSIPCLSLHATSTGTLPFWFHPQRGRSGSALPHCATRGLCHWLLSQLIPRLWNAF